MSHDPHDPPRTLPHRLRHLLALLRLRKDVLAMAGSLLFAVLFRAGADLGD